MALAHPSMAVVGVSAVHGNASCLQVAHNILRVLTAAARYMPLAAAMHVQPA